MSQLIKILLSIAFTLSFVACATDEVPSTSSPVIAQHGTITGIATTALDGDVTVELLDAARTSVATGRFDADTLRLEWTITGAAGTAAAATDSLATGFAPTVEGV